MAHSHAYSHGEPENTYFLDQLCTIAACGLIGFVAVMGYRTGLLDRIKLHPDFRIPVLIGGGALLVMVVLRAIALWRQAGEARSELAEEYSTGRDDHVHGEKEACGHEHAHGETCGHEHAHGHEHSHAHGHEHSHAHGHEHSHSHDHDHGHSHGNNEGHSHGGDGHDHGWAPWTYAVLLLPVVLYFLGLPTAGENLTRRDRNLVFKELDPGARERRVAAAKAVGTVYQLSFGCDAQKIENAVMQTFKKQGPPLRLRFTDLKVYADRQNSRDYFEGRTVTLVGQFFPNPGKDREFKLYREKITCCGNDAVYLQTLIVAPEPLRGLSPGEWVEITGELSFRKQTGENQWLPVIDLPSNADIKKAAARDPFDDV